MRDLLGILCWPFTVLLAVWTIGFFAYDGTAEALARAMPVLALMALRSETACWIGRWRVIA